jgi:hypothetical protein
MTKKSVTSSFDEYVVRGILAVNKSDISEVNNLESLKSIFFISEHYTEIEQIIKTGQIDLLKAIPEDKPGSGEFLDIMLFEDQSHKRYIVTVYDSIVLEQDPQVIEIYPL